MKKIVSVLLLLTMIFAVTGCSAKDSSKRDNENSTDKAAAKEQTSLDSDAPQKTDPSEKRAVVAYFSASGNTQNVANYIKEATNADLFEIVPKDKYTEEDLDWTDKKSRVNAEHDDESKRVIELEAVTPDNWADYDTVFIGYPIWWGIAAWPVDTFVKGNNFDGKTVIPFCTSASSELGESGELLKQMAGAGNWLEGKRFQSSVSEDEVNDWLKTLEY